MGEEKLNNRFRERLGLSTITFKDYSLQDALTAAVELGLSVVEVGALPGFCPHMDWKNATLEEELEIVRLLLSTPLRLQGFNVKGDFNDPKIQPELVLLDARRALRMAAAAGADAVCFGGGVKAEASLVPGLIRQVAPYYRTLAREAESLGLAAVIEAPHRGGLLRTTQNAMDLIEAIDHPNAYLVFDCAHHHASGIALDEAIRIVGDRIRFVHLRDRLGGSNCYPLGSGEIDFAQVIRMLEQVGYSGDYGFEFPVDGKSLEELSQLVRQSIDFMENGCVLS
ncbi:sugar phosphate isomerase/epimerase family protein [Paenibacillus roseipurpureus]|uniref:Sugar phosphate isomerase/epimerase n=1 Tax=Paenibacillus roseopurpureus TaxID=2918901 RepID=A0AA96LVA3_9BACL|nr:sugar phosphate isomerase/epimerase [Paenibacillus sp. MBLB1832]WNR45295.1 sugar phosphate isomerase/epimerase [Paenibacillus sp. MBLB1832]